MKLDAIKDQGFLVFIHHDRIDNLNKLMDLLQLDSLVDLINEAITFFSWTIEEIKAGNEVASINEKGEVYKIMEMESFSEIQKGEINETNPQLQ